MRGGTLPLSARSLRCSTWSSGGRGASGMGPARLLLFEGKSSCQGKPASAHQERMACNDCNLPEQGSCCYDGGVCGGFRVQSSRNRAAMHAHCTQAAGNRHE